jgi:hypothetical protein
MKIRRRLGTRSAFERFEAALDRIVTALPELPPRMPDVLYHYTDWEGFGGIVSSQNVRAKAHQCMDDKAELQTLDDVISDVVKELAAQLPQGRATHHLLIDFLREYPRLKIANHRILYLACFSAARDKPSLWNSFAKRGSGVCLGFKILFDEGSPDEHVASANVFTTNGAGVTRCVFSSRGCWRHTKSPDVTTLAT